MQGTQAAPLIARMITLAAARRDCDVLILARGGGNLEDLWAFNEECVARAIYDCDIPLVTGIGHEIDFTIADFAADLRAPTPSGAAELISPDREEWRQSLAAAANRLRSSIRQQLSQENRRLAWLLTRLQQQHPGQRLQQWNQRLDELEQRLSRALNIRLKHHQSLLREYRARLQHHNPLQRITQKQAHCHQLQQRLKNAIRQQLDRSAQQLQGLCRALDVISPLATLGRGYTVLSRLPEHELLHDARQVQPGDRVEARLAQGRIVANVIESHRK